MGAKRLRVLVEPNVLDALDHAVRRLRVDTLDEEKGALHPLEADRSVQVRPGRRPRYLRRGVEPEGTERVRVCGRDATLVVWSPDYDGKGKARVRFDDGTDAIVGGSRVER